MAGGYYDIVCLWFRRVAAVQVGMGPEMIDNPIIHPWI